MVSHEKLDQIHNLVKGLFDASQHLNLPIIVGTDGSSHRHAFITRGCWGLASQQHAVAGKLQGWDQTPDCAEAWAGCICILALFAFLPHDPPPVILLCDNLNLVNKLHTLIRKSCPLPCWPHWALFCAIQRKLNERPDIHLRPIWIPSHGKNKPWDIPPEFPDDVCRSINDAADVAASHSNENAFYFCHNLSMAAKVRNTWMTNALLFLQFAIRDLQVYNSQNEVPRDG